MSLLFAPEPNDTIPVCDCGHEIIGHPDYPDAFCPDGCDGPWLDPNGVDLHLPTDDGEDSAYDTWNER